jgi:hypothetical protein
MFIIPFFRYTHQVSIRFTCHFTSSMRFVGTRFQPLFSFFFCLDNFQDFRVK